MVLAGINFVKICLYIVSECSTIRKYFIPFCSFETKLEKKAVIAMLTANAKISLSIRFG